MKYNQFIKLVQKRADLDTEAEALKAVEATLSTLSERITEGEVENLSAQLPREIKAALIAGEHAKSFDLKDFYYEVSRRESLGQPLAMKHARAVMSVVEEAVSPGELRDLLAQLPEEEYMDLFTFGSDFHNLS